MLSFVIPAKNEAGGIERCVSSIKRHAPADGGLEIIVVDNGSEDETARIAREAGATVLDSAAGTIGAARNRGVDASRGDMLVFLDADCALTPEWGAEFGRVSSEMSTLRPCVAGSQVFPPADESVFLWTYWFLPFVAQESASHIGSANMICSREDFLSVEGFDESLETGEDFDFCSRLLKEGGGVLNVPALRVEHYGFPRDWGSFMRRERWHGRGDVGSLRAFATSKVAVASTLFVLLLLGSVATAILGLGWLSLIPLLGAAVLLVAASTVKFRHAGPGVQAMTLVILPVYFVARFLSAIDVVLGRNRRS